MWHPAAAFVVAVAFASPCLTRVYSRRSRTILGTVSLAWLAYAGWETYMTNWRSPSGDMPIRVDMVFLGPVLLLLGVLGLITAVRGYRRPV